jgi:hypothetical protein
MSSATMPFVLSEVEGQIPGVGAKRPSTTPLRGSAQDERQ